MPSETISFSETCGVKLTAVLRNTKGLAREDIQMKTKKWFESGMTDNIFPAETEFNRTIREMEERDAQMYEIVNSPAMQAAMSAATLSLANSARVIVPNKAAW